jgi:diguanylate cyclase (GGDEF)-like protein
MNTTPTPTLRVLIVDDEPAMRDTYRQILLGSRNHVVNAAKLELRAKLFAAAPAPSAQAAEPTFELTVCGEALSAVEAVRLSLKEGRSYTCVFLDMRMPPGRDGAWAAEHIRALDKEIEIIICSAFSDIEPAALALRAGPADKIFYLQKPFHPHEVLQAARSLGQKWHASRRLRKVAFIDSLTGIPNQVWFKEKLEEEVERARTENDELTLMSLDVDSFRRINDTLGHGAGDEMLRTIANLLKADAMLERDSPEDAAATVARVAGDEFALLIKGPAGEVRAKALAGRLKKSLLLPITLRNREILMTVCIGIACFSRDGMSAEILRRNAGLALNAAKKTGPGNVQTYELEMSAAAGRRLTLEEQLRGALERNEFYLMYQPQMDLDSGVVWGLEALLRWENSELGEVPPLEFIGIARELGLMCDLGEWVLRTACAQACAWYRAGIFRGMIGVNVSCAQLIHMDFPALVAKVLKDTGMNPVNLELEVTESLSMKHEIEADKAFAQLKALGVMLALDEFGTGDSSFSRLQYLPFDRVKIDQSFVSGIHERASDRAMLVAMIKMTQMLGLEVIAEGVENPHQLRRLRESGCAKAQGYLLSEPLKIPEVQALLARAAEADDGSRTSRSRTQVA